MCKVAIYGGTFNPIHNGHIISLQYLLEDQHFTNVLLVPSGKPPFKSEESQSIIHRAHMCNEVVKLLPPLILEDYELNTKELSYTYNTLQHLSKQNPDIKYYWTIGYDNLFSVENWYKGKEILREFGLIVINRGGYSFDDAMTKEAELTKCYHTDFINITIPSIEISSTEIRKRVNNHQSIVGYTLQSIIDYIEENNLYKEV